MCVCVCVFPRKHLDYPMAYLGKVGRVFVQTVVPGGSGMQTLKAAGPPALLDALHLLL